MCRLSNKLLSYKLSDRTKERAESLYTGFQFTLMAMAATQGIHKLVLIELLDMAMAFLAQILMLAVLIRRMEE